MKKILYGLFVLMSIALVTTHSYGSGAATSKNSKISVTVSNYVSALNPVFVAPGVVIINPYGIAVTASPAYSDESMISGNFTALPIAEAEVSYNYRYVSWPENFISYIHPIDRHKKHRISNLAYNKAPGRYCNFKS